MRARFSVIFLQLTVGCIQLHHYFGKALGKRAMYLLREARAFRNDRASLLLFRRTAGFKNLLQVPRELCRQPARRYVCNRPADVEGPSARRVKRKLERNTADE